jgi:cold shock CspA family protein
VTRGHVSAFDEASGLGVVTGSDGTALQFHCVEIADGTRKIDVGTDVEYDVLPKLGQVEARRIRPTPPT